MRSYYRIIGVFTWLIVFTLLYIPAANTQASAYQNWNGVWLTNHGEVTLRQEGKNISGTYCANNGLNSRLAGTLTDEWGWGLRGKYYEGIESGVFDIRIVDSNKSFQGWLSSPDNAWMGKRVTDSYTQVKLQTMTVINNSPYHINALFISPANAENWQEFLDAKALRHGEQKNIIFKLDRSVCSWDIKIVDSSGNFMTFQNLWINPEFTSINYYYRDGSGYIEFAVG